MKNFIKGRWFPLMVVVVFEVALGGFLYYNDFRITYAPNLENSWDAISAFAAWAGVLASLIAIWSAIQVPKRIAEGQNRIALFERNTKYIEKYVIVIRFVTYLSWRKM